MDRNQIIANIIKEKGIEAHGYTAVKADGIHLAVAIGEGNICPIIYIDEADERPDEEIADSIIEAYQNLEKPDNDIAHEISDMFADWDKVKKNLMICLRPIRNDDNFVTMPVGIECIEAYVRIRVKDIGSIIVTSNYLEKWNVTKDELFEVAYKNEKFSVLDHEIEMNDGSKSVYVLENTRGFYGANALLYTEYLNDLLNEMGEHYIIIVPFSVHKIIVYPGSRDKNNELAFLKAELQIMNDMYLEDDEILSYALYKYDKNGFSIFM